MRDLALALVSTGALLLLGMLLYRFRRGAWSLEDDEVPPPSPGQVMIASLAGGFTAIGTVLFIWSYFSNGVG